MRTVVRVIGWTLASFGAIFLLLSPIPYLDDENSSAMFGFIMFGLAGTIPGGLILFLTDKRRDVKLLMQQLSGFVNTRDSFTIPEIAGLMRQKPEKVEYLLMQLIDKQKFDLVFHRTDLRYIHRDKIQNDADIIKNCHNCGATLRSQLVLPGDQVDCPYCGSSLSV